MIIGKKYRIWFLILFTILFTGCDVTYNLEIKDNKIIESADVYFEEKDAISTLPNYKLNSDGTLDFSSDSVEQINLEDFRNSVFGDNYNAFYDSSLAKDYYNKKKIDDSIGINYKYSFDLSNYGNSLMLNSCFDDISVKKNKNNLILDLKDSSYCFNDIYQKLSSVTVKVKTDYKVLDNNADEVSSNVYIWNLSLDGESKDIYMKINIPDRENSNYLFIIIIIIVFVLFIIYLCIHIRNKSISNNEI